MSLTPPRACAACATTMSRARQWIYECPRCGFLTSTLEPGAGLAVEGVDALRRSNFALLMDRLSRHMTLRGARVLEIGSGHGLFLDAAHARGCTVTGIEADPLAVAHARARGHHVIEGFFPSALSNDELFDIVALNDVFEHLPSPDEMAPVLESVIAPGGILVVNLPSRAGIFYRLASLLAVLGFDGPLGRLWQCGLPSPHVSYFNPRNLDMLFARTTGLSAEDAMSLPTLSRTSLRERLDSADSGLPAWITLPTVWTMSWIAPWLPKDILVGFYRKRSA